MTIKKFEVGRTYWTRSMVDYDSILSFVIRKRTDKTVTVNDDRYGKIVRKIAVNGDCETFYPHGKHSMCPVIWANSDTLVKPMPADNPSYL